MRFNKSKGRCGGRGNIELLERRRLLSTVVYTVQNTLDGADDNGSLRFALTQANALASTDHAIIEFQFGSGVTTIKPQSPLPPITGRVDILGPTDSAGNPLLVLDGVDAGAGANGLEFDRSASADTAASVVSGLIIQHFSADGIDIEGSAPTDVFGCWIGTDSTGKRARPNGTNGIEIATNDDKIGQEGSAAFADLISGNVGDGIFVDPTVTGNTIQNCRIGTDVTGRKPLGNGGDGMRVEGDETLIGGDRPGEGNLVSGNGGNGIDVAAIGCVVYANLVGTNAAGTAAVPNALVGVNMDGGENNEIGNVGSAFANVISGNGGPGIELGNASSITVTGNSIGTNEAQKGSIANVGDGIDVVGGSDNTITQNAIAGNKHNGVLIENGSTGNQVTGDEIGIADDLNAELPNGDNGVEIFKSAGNEVNNCLIIDNKLAGVQINGLTADENELTQNNIFGNGELGICLGADTDTPLPNHSGLAKGPNDDQNYPVLTTARDEGSDGEVKGTLSALADEQYSIELYENSSADPSGFGQGMNPLFTLRVTTDGNGNASFAATDLTLSSKTPFVTAVAIDITGEAATLNDTSEFSKAIKVKFEASTAAVETDLVMGIAVK